MCFERPICVKNVFCLPWTLLGDITALPHLDLKIGNYHTLGVRNAMKLSLLVKNQT